MGGVLAVIVVGGGYNVKEEGGDGWMSGIGSGRWEKEGRKIIIIRVWFWKMSVYFRTSENDRETDQSEGQGMIT